MEGYKFMYANNRDLTTSDLESINTTMHPELFDVRTTVDGTSIAKINGFESDGTPIFSLTNEAISAAILAGEIVLPEGVTMDDVDNFRNGEIVHGRQYYNTIRGQFPDVNEQEIEQLRGVTMDSGDGSLGRPTFTQYTADGLHSTSLSKFYRCREYSKRRCI